MAATLKAKHIYGTPGQATERYLSIASRGLSAEGNNAIRANSKYFIIPWAGQGTVAVFNIGETGAGPEDRPTFTHFDDDEGTLENVNDFDMSPFDTQLWGSVTNSVGRLWRIPEEGLQATTEDPLCTFAGHSKRILGFSFHPSAENVACTYAADKLVKLWDCGDSSSPVEKLTLPEVHKGMISSLSWNYDGSQCATACKDKTLRLFDPRANACSAEVADHQGAKAFKATWLGGSNSDLILTAGFSKGTPRRKLHLYDARDLSNRLTEVELDAQPSIMFPIWDEDLNIVYLGGKGDGDMRILEITPEAPFINIVTTFKSSDPMVGIAPLPKTSNDVKTTEVKKFLKLCNTSVVPIRFQIPRQNAEFAFQEDLFPDTRGPTAATSADGWFAGESAAPVLVNLKPDDY